MNVMPTGGRVVYNGNEVARYGRDFQTNECVAVWYHSGIGGEPMWAMDTDVEWKISVSVDTILVNDDNNGLFAIDRDEFTESTRMIDNREQYIASAHASYVTDMGDPQEHLNGDLYMDCDNSHPGYHVDKNEA